MHRFDFSAAGSDHIYKTHYTNPLGARTRLHFDPEYRLQEIEFVETGERRTFTWAGLRPATVTLESGATTTYSYAGDDPVAITDAAGNTIRDHVPARRARSGEPALAGGRPDRGHAGPVEERSYDGSGRVVGITNGESESVDLTYNGVSLVASLTQPTGATLTFPLYGQHGHWLEMDGAVSDKRSFDTSGNPKVESAKGRRGGVLDQQFDANRWLSTLNVAATDASGVTGTGAITIERRSDGQPLAVRRPYGGDHEFGYDALGRLALQRERVERPVAGDGLRTRPRREHDRAQPPERDAGGVGVRRLRPRRRVPRAAKRDARGRGRLHLSGRPARLDVRFDPRHHRAVRLRRRRSSGAHDLRLRRDPEPRVRPAIPRHGGGPRGPRPGALRHRLRTRPREPADPDARSRGAGSADRARRHRRRAGADPLRQRSRARLQLRQPPACSSRARPGTRWTR